MVSISLFLIKVKSCVHDFIVDCIITKIWTVLFLHYNQHTISFHFLFYKSFSSIPRILY